jgi:hypothetical protein
MSSAPRLYKSALETYKRRLPPLCIEHKRPGGKRHHARYMRCFARLRVTATTMSNGLAANVNI